jgi:hypothetical protein
VHRDQQIGDKFHPAAFAERAEIVADPGETVEHRAGAAESGLVAAAIEREIAGHSLRAGAGQRAIERDDARGGEPVARPLLDVDRQGADLGDNETRPWLCSESRGGRVQRFSAR